MKPITLAMKNFGPYQEVKIDFSTFEAQANQLFLISGPTGAGKTTIFDGMTYALYGVSSSDRDAKELRSDFAAEEEQTKVEFVFEHHGKFYRVVRTPAQEIKRRKTPRPATQTISEVSYPALIPLGSAFTKSGEVKAFVEELLGLNADQFRQIILLPQNEFRKFLLAPSEDKETILRKLFDTGRFRRLMEMIKERQSGQEKELQELENNLAHRLQDIPWGAAEAAEQTNEEKILSLQALLKTEQEKNIQLIQAEEKARQAAEAAEKQYDAAVELEQFWQQLAQAETALSTERKRKDEIAQAKETLISLDWAEKQLKEDQALHQLTDQEKELAVRREAAQKVRKAALLDQQLHQLEQDALAEKNGQYLDSKTQLAAVESRFLPKAIQKERVVQEQKKLASLNEQLEKTLSEVKKRIALTETRKKEREKAARQLPDLKEFGWFLQQAEKEFAAEQATLAKIKTTAKKREKAAAAVIDQEKLLQIREGAQKQAEQTHHDALKAQNDLIIVKLRQELKEGEACPVCGSTAHPDAQRLAKEKSTEFSEELHTATENVQVSEKELVAAMDARRDVSAALQAASEREKQLTSDENELIHTQQINAAELLERWCARLPEAPKEATLKSAMTALKAYGQVLKEKTQQLAEDVENAQKALDQLQGDQESKQSEWQTNHGRKAALEAQLEEITREIPELESVSTLQERQSILRQFLSNFEKRMQEFQQKKIEIEKKLAASQQAMQQLERESAVLTGKLQAAQTAAEQMRNKRPSSAALEKLPEYQHAIQAGQIDRLKQEITRHEERLELLTSKKETLQQVIASRPHPDLTVLAAEKNRQREIAREKLLAASKQASLVEQLTKKTAEILHAAAELEKKSEAQKEYFALNEALQGRNPLKLGLERFILQRYLAEVLQHANEHYLPLLSSGRYLFTLKKEKASYAKQTGLEIEVFDGDTNEERPANTLSGGESFIASLALALSLAEVVQESSGKASVEALFIDEGFGSLDDETLEKALAALEAIGQTGRLVGVISHVQELKRAIASQLMIVKCGDGTSKVKIEFS